MITLEQSSWMRLLITGSRTYRNKDYVCDVLWGYRKSYGPMIVVHGDCAEGPDAYARAWAEDYMVFGVDHDPVPVADADWNTYGPAAGPRRNMRMADHLASLSVSGVVVRCLAFIDPCTKLSCRRQPRPHGSHGATQCADYAEDLGISTTRYETYERARA